MPAKNPRINVVIDHPSYELIRQKAEKQGASLSLVARDLIKEALEMEEGLALGQLAARREESYDGKTALSHDEVWR